MSGALTGRFFAGSAGFSPTDLPGLVLWLDAAAITGKVQGNTVTTWTDSSGQGNDATEATDPPTYDDGSSYPEGVPGVLFDALAERLDVAPSASLALSQCTYIVTARLLDVNVATAGTAAQVETFAASDLSAAAQALNVGALVVSARARNQATGPQNLQLVTRTGATDYFSANVSGIGTGYAPFQNVWATNPNTAADWTPSEINGVEIGVKSIT